MTLSFIFEKWLFSNKTDWHSKTQVLVPENFEIGRSVILIHGFVGSPYDMKILGEQLSQNGFRVIIPVMAGQTHATPLNQRKKYSDQYYIKQVRDLIRQEHDRTGKKPYLVGFSMGGAISTIIAKENTIEKLVLIAPFYQLPRIIDRAWRITKLLSCVLPCVPKLSKGKINDKKGYAVYWPGSYLISLKAFNQLGVLAGMARESVDKIFVETLIFLSMNDQVASSVVTVHLFQGKTNTKIYFLNKANHILLYDYGADKMIKQILEFFIKKDSY